MSENTWCTTPMRLEGKMSPNGVRLLQKHRFCNVNVGAGDNTMISCTQRDTGKRTIYVTNNRIWKVHSQGGSRGVKGGSDDGRNHNSLFSTFLSQTLEHELTATELLVRGEGRLGFRSPRLLGYRSYWGPYVAPGGGTLRSVSGRNTLI